MTAIQKINTMPSIQEMNQITEMCKVLATSPYYKAMGPGGVLSIWLTAREMGLPPMMCLNGGMYTFSGAVSLSAGLMNYLITSAGHRVEVIELSEERCTLKFVRGDRQEGKGDSMEYTFSKKDAERAGYLNKKNWIQHPRDMMFNRCLSGGARKYMPDAIMGAYIEGEIEEESKEKYPVKMETQFVEIPPKEISMPSIREDQINQIKELLEKCSTFRKMKFSELMTAKYKSDDLNLISVDNFNEVTRWLTEGIKLDAEVVK